MQKAGTRLIIIGKDQVYTDMPEYRNHPNPTYQNERVRGTGGLGVTSFGEENLLNLPLDRYDDESIAVHEFCHTIDAALRAIDPAWRDRLAQTYRTAIGKGLWKNAYAASNPAEYWAEICQVLLRLQPRQQLEPRPDRHTRTTEAVRPRRLRVGPDDVQLDAGKRLALPPVRRQPSVMAPPAKFKIDPYYTKFTLAREFTVLGSKRVSDEALLKANDTDPQDVRLSARHPQGDDRGRRPARGIGPRREVERFARIQRRGDKPGFDEVRYLDYTPNAS